MCTAVHICAEVCTALQTCAQLCAQLCTPRAAVRRPRVEGSGGWICPQLCRLVHSSVDLCTAVRTRAQLCRIVHGPADLCTTLPNLCNISTTAGRRSCAYAHNCADLCTAVQTCAPLCVQVCTTRAPGRRHRCRVASGMHSCVHNSTHSVQRVGCNGSMGLRMYTHRCRLVHSCAHLCRSVHSFADLCTAVCTTLHT